MSGAAAIVIVYACIRMCAETFQLYHTSSIYFLNHENFIDLYLYASSIAYMAFSLSADCQCLKTWQWEFGATTLLIAWLNLLLVLKTIPYFGEYILMFMHISGKIVKALIPAALFLVAFGLTFYMLFFRPVSKINCVSCNLSNLYSRFLN